jgi:hypothetical protein
MMRLYPGGATLPSSSSLNFSAGQSRANNAAPLLGPGGDLAIFASQATGSVDVLIDVNGYFE